MADTFTFTIKPITDLSDVKANVGTIQNYFDKLKMPKFSNQIKIEADKISKAYENINKKQIEGIKTTSDASYIEKNQNVILHSWNEILEVIKEVSQTEINIDFDKFTTQVKEAEQAVESLRKEIDDKLANSKVDLSKLTDSKTGALRGDNALGKVTQSKAMRNFANQMDIALQKKQYTEFLAIYKEAQQYVDKNPMFGDKVKNNMSIIGEEAKNIENAIGSGLIDKLSQAEKYVNDVKSDAVKEVAQQFGNCANKAEEYGAQAEGAAAKQKKLTDGAVELNKTAQTIERQVESYFGLNAIFRTVANMAREAMNTVKELDAAMTETAVVTNFSVGDMWEKLPLYTQQANALGSSIKDVYEATTLYYQQGLNTTQSMGLAVETLKMARIAGMDAKDATDAMTAALRGFNLELNQASAQRINDVYSELAAITASDTQEISTAMEKVASLAHNAGMELETTSAFLAQMIETTREAPENLGTALKTVVARFQEMKQDPTKLIDSEGVMLDANKVDKALKSIGVNLLNTNGEFRKLDDVFLEIASKWDTLSMGQQRYIATMAAGSRQQSRFIAMMSNYSRTMELVDAAYDSSGASQRQFEKTLESMDAKLNKLKNAYDQFIMGLMNNNFLKGVVDSGTEALTVLNNIIDTISGWTGPLKSTTKMILTLISTFGGLTAARGLLKGGISLGVQWFGGKEAKSKWNEFIGKDITNKVTAQGLKDGSAYREAFKKQVSGLSTFIQQGIQAPVRIKTYDKKSSYIQQLQNEIRKKDPQVSEEYLQGIEKNINVNGINKAKEIAKSWGIETVELNNRLETFGMSATKAGTAMQAFGNVLLQTPLAPFGKSLQITGVAVSTFGGLFLKAGAVIAAGAKTGMTAIEALTASITASPLFPFVIAAIAVAGAGALIYYELTRDKREMEALAEAAKTSSDAFDNLKTATETLKNSINDIRNSDSLFDGLVVGTTEWNLALVEANQQVLDLIKKYPMLQKYATTDANGRMSISEAGFKAVQDEQNKLLGQAQALDIYNNALHNVALARQEQDKLLKDEDVTKTKAKTVKHGRDSYTITEEQADEINYNALSDEGKREWGGIEAKIKAESEAANKQAIRAALSTSGELNDTVLNLFSQNFEDAQEAFKGETDMSVMKQAYADFIGGVFDSVTGTITNLSDEEVDIDNEAIQKMYPQIMALLQFQNQAPQVESAVKSLGKSFDSLFGNKEGSTFINDLLENNLETDASAINKFLNTSDTEIEKVLENISDEEVKAIMQSDTAQKSDLINLLKTNADNLKQAQTQSYKDATIWYAKVVKKWSSVTAKVGAASLASTITKGLTVKSADTINNFLNQMSQSFDSAALSTMGESLYGALLDQPDDIQQELDGIVNNVDWSSAIERGKFYEEFKEDSEAFGKLNTEGQKFVKTTKQIDKGLDLTGKQFEELVQSSDFLEILTNKWSDFADESGKVDATGIREMAKECGTLSEVLNLAEFDADNLAMALNYFQSTGSFEGITGAVLAAIDEFDSLDKLIGQVKKDIDIFTPGENYEQGIEAFRGYAKSLKENYEGGKYSSADTLSYAQALTNINWKDYVKKYGKSNKSAEKELIDSLSPLFTESEKDTTLNILKRMEKGQTIAGTKAGKTDAFTIGRGEEGQLQLRIDEKTTREEFQQALQDAYGFSEEFARAFTLSLEGQDWGFIDDNITDGFNKAGRSEGIARFVKKIADRSLLQIKQDKKGNIIDGQINGQQIGRNNQLVISQSELKALRDLGGYENIKEVREALANELGVSVEHIRSFNEETQNADSYLKKRFGKKGTQESRAENFLDDFKDSDGITNFDKTIAELEKSGITASKALDMAVEMATTAGEEEVKWGNQLVPLADVINGEGFYEAVDKLEDEAKWITVGEKIGEAVADVLYEHGIGKKPEDKTDESQDSTKKTTGNKADFNKADEKATKKIEKKQQQEEKTQNNIEQRNKQKEETLTITPQVNYSEARGEYINYKKDVEKNPPETEVKGNTKPLKNNVDKEVNAIESNPAIKPIDANDRSAIAKDGALVSTIQKTATKTVALNTQQADQANRDAESRYSKPVSKTINLKTILGGLSSIPQKIRDWLNGSGASGINNYVSPSGFYTGSMARGNGKGMLGPKGKGGLTLTGERGFEIAWLPSENRSMILGAHGPQMTNLPADAVVWNHKQSKHIVAQKGIPLGSMGTGNFDDSEVDVTSNNGQVKVQVTVDEKNKKNNNNNNNNNNDSNKKDPHTNWLQVEIDRYNISQKINKITEKIEKSAKKIDDSLSKIGTTYKKISKNVDTEISLTNDNIKYQQELQKSYNKSLRNLANGSRSLWVSLQSKNKDGEWESKEELIDTSKYITREKDGTYSINRNKIANDYSLQPNREAIFNALQSEIDKLTNGANSAAQEIANAQQKIKDIKEQVKEAFFAWENELTKIYDLAQQIADADARRTRFASENGLLMAQIGAGYKSAASAGKRLIQIQKQDIQLIKERVKLTQEDIAAKREQLSRDASSKDEKEIWQSIKQRNKEKKAQGKKLTTKEIAQEEAAKDNYLAAKYTNKYVKRTRQADGSYKFDFNEEKLERDRRSGKINQETYDVIKEGFDTMVESNETYQQSISDGFDYLAEIYEQYGEYVKTMADLESDLINAYEKAAQKEVQKLEFLNSSLTASFKKVIDQVKRNIDNRRRQEDNLKTEGDIAQKQQRLAMLRANTSGGNRAEIVQLEKEIGDAQTQYGRTLEDQMLSNMQQQADQAAQQRQEQIDLAKQQIEYNKEAGIYAAQADKLLKDVKGNATQIQNVLDVTKDQTTGKWGDKVWKAEIQTKIADGITASAGITDLQTQLSNNSSAINTLADILTGLNKNSTKTKKKTSKKNQPKKKELKKEEPQKEKSKKEEPKKEESKKKESSLLKVTTPVKQQVAAALWHDAVGLGWGNGKTRYNRLVSVFGPKNADAIQAIVNKGSNKQVPYKKGYDYKTQKQKKYKKYLSGGLANSTGPAWLDGTPTKPELVLNAQDTKNFIALKDVLSSVMKDISHMSSTETYNAPTEININVNVDKIGSDYDVDKLAKRLKNDIVKDMNYRNVTQVRNFR